jgi:hypothetical protein
MYTMDAASEPAAAAESAAAPSVRIGKKSRKTDKC